MIKLLTSGFWTSIQDLGRFGYRDQGIPLSGAMDRTTAMEANRIAGNAAHTPLLELTASGPKMHCDQGCFMVVCGGFDLVINGQKHPAGVKSYVPKQAEIDFVANGAGMRGYLAIRGGFQAPEVLGSYSQFKQLTEASRLVKGDELELAPSGYFPSWKPFKTKKRHESNILSAYPGPEWEMLSDDYRKELLSRSWSIGPGSNRMAYVLEAQNGLKGFDIVTAPVQPGTVQLTPAGKLVILMRDAQTTGGYARVFQLDEASVDYLAQRSAGEDVQFKLL